MFATTQWSLVLAARNSTQADAALAELCRRYRAPVLAFLRRSGQSAADAEDLAQGFFVKLLEQRFDTSADPARGRFRSFLLGALRHHLGDSLDARQAQRRGGGVVHADIADGADSLADGGRTPEQTFDHEYALVMVDRAMGRLRDEAIRAGYGERHALLAPLLLESREPGALEQAAQALGLRANTLAVMLSRWRERLSQLIREELLETLADPAQVDEEMRALRAVLRG